MNKVINAHLNGRLFQIEEDGYLKLTSYLNTAKEKLADNPDKEEIILDIEQAIAEKCTHYLQAHKNVLLTSEIEKIIAEMGPVQDNADSSQKTDGQEQEKKEYRDPRKLYQIRQGAIIFGVCNGIAAYFNVDVTLVRILFVLLSMLTGGGFIFAYFIMGILIPKAETPEQKRQASGAPFNAQDIVDRAKEGWENLSSWHQKFETMHDEHKAKTRSEKRRRKSEFKARMKEYKRTNEATPFFVLMNVILSLVLAFEIASLFSRHIVFGFAIPSSVPLWIALIVLLCLYNLIASPLRMAHYSHGYQYEYHPYDAWLDTLNGIAWLGFLFLIGWILYTYVPGVHEVLNTTVLKIQSKFSR